MDYKAFLAIGLTGTALLCSLALVLNLPQLLVVLLLLVLGVAVSWLGADHIKTTQTLNMQGRVLSGLHELHRAGNHPEVIHRIRQMLQRLFPEAEVRVYTDPITGIDPVTGSEAISSRVRQSIGDSRILILNGRDEELKMPRGVNDLAVLPLPGPESESGALLLINAAQPYGLKNLEVLLGILYKHMALVLTRFQEQEKEKDIAQNLLAISATAMESHQPSYCGHAQRVATISQLIGQRLGMGQTELDSLIYAALLHDVGRWIPALDDGVDGADKEDKVNEVDHAAMGADLMPEGETYAEIREAIRYHHERYDGQGYPKGLKHTEIPLAARIIAVADEYDRLTVLVAEQERHSHSSALAAVKKGIGTRFDPLVVVALEEVAAENPPSGPAEWLNPDIGSGHV